MSIVVSRIGRRPTRSESRPSSAVDRNCIAEKTNTRAPYPIPCAPKRWAYMGRIGSTMPKPIRSIRTVTKMTARRERPAVTARSPGTGGARGPFGASRPGGERAATGHGEGSRLRRGRLRRAASRGHPQGVRGVRILLDTQVWLWMLAAPERLASATKQLVVAPDNELLLSAASAWEIAIKYALGKVRLPDAPEHVVPQLMART